MAPIPTTGGPGATNTSGGGIDWNPLNWFSDASQAVGNWLGGLAGDIASGIEGGVISILRDTFGWLLPYIEIIIGVLLLLWVFVFYFKDDIVAAARMVAPLIAMAG